MTPKGGGPPPLRASASETRRATGWPRSRLHREALATLPPRSAAPARRRARRTRLTGLALLACGLLSGCSLQQSIAAQPATTGNGGAATPITGRATTGAPISVSMREGVTLIDFWGSWCGPCRAEQATLNNLDATYHPRGVTFIGVDMEDDTASANAYRSDYSVPYQSIEDATGSIAAAYDVTAPPTVIVVDRHGTIVGRFLGTLRGVTTALDRALSG